MRRVLTEDEAKKILVEYKIPVVKEILVRSEDEAVRAARQIGYPIVLKIVSPDIIHKTEARGVLLNISSEKELIEGYDRILKNASSYRPSAQIKGVLVQEMINGAREVILGLFRDAQFGAVVMFGLGGIFVEILKDISFRVAPVTIEEALKMIKEIKAYKILEGVRGEKAFDITAVADVIVRVSRLGIERSEILELDINPLFVFERGVLAADARIVAEK